MRQLLCALVFAIVATPAFADPPEGELTAAPGSIAIGMIERADAIDVFDIVHNGQVSVRHLGSGLRCHFMRDGAGGRIMLFPGLPRGDDVACDTTDGRENVTLYATRLPFPSTLEELLGSANAALHSHFPNAQAYAASQEMASDGITPPLRTSQFLVQRADGARIYMRISVAQVGAWVIKQRYATLAPDDEAARQGEQTSSMSFAGVLGEIVATPSP